MSEKRSVLTITGYGVRNQMLAMIPEFLESVPISDTSPGTYRLILEFVRDRKRVLSADGCIRMDESGSPWLLNKRENGWGSIGFQYSSWADLLDEWDIGVGAPQADEHGTYWPIIPRSKS